MGWRLLSLARTGCPNDVLLNWVCWPHFVRNMISLPTRFRLLKLAQLFIMLELSPCFVHLSHTNYLVFPVYNNAISCISFVLRMGTPTRAAACICTPIELLSDCKIYYDGSNMVRIKGAVEFPHKSLYIDLLWSPNGYSAIYCWISHCRLFEYGLWHNLK